ncbi:MAG: hypothetical protein Q8942_04340 [Bacillota bacterium]|nr:hypothetical protein [Bacillota bacterium]
MKTRGYFKIVSFLLIFCIMMLNLRVVYSESLYNSLLEAPASVTSEVYSMTPTPTVTSEVYSMTPIPTVTSEIYSMTPIPTVISEVYSMTPTPIVIPTPTLSNSDDYGNTKESAYDVKVLDKVEGVSTSKDRDYFRFKCAENGLYRVNFDFFDCEDIYILNVLNIVDENGASLIADCNGNSVVFEFKKEKSCFLVIKNSGNPNYFKYAFSISTPIVDDYSDTKDNAKEIKLDNEVKGEINTSGDVDCFKFVPSESSCYYLDKLSVKSTFGEDDIKLYQVFSVYGSNYLTVNVDYSDMNAVSFCLTKGITYYISFKSSFTNNLFTYSFILKKPAIKDVGNSFSYAEKINIGKTYDSRIDYQYDEDYWSFTTDSEGLYNLSISNNVNCYVYDRYGRYVDKCKLNLDGDEKYYYFSSNETYFIKITYYKSTDYSFYIKEPIVDDFPNEANKANVIKSETPVKGTINYSGDIDYMQFTPQNTGAIYIQFDGSSNLELKLFSLQNDYIESEINYEKVSDNIYCVNLKDTKSLFIKVVGLDKNSKEDYTLMLSDSFESVGHDSKAGGLDSETKIKDNSVISSVYTTSDTLVDIPDAYKVIQSDVSIDDDFGNTILNPQTITEKSPISGKLESSSDTDMFSFTSCFEGDTVLEITSDKAITPSILDYRGKAVNYNTGCESLDSGSKKYILKFFVNKGMRYFIKLKSSQDGMTNYTFDYNYLIDDFSDSFGDASDINSGETKRVNFINDEDVDVLKFKAPENGIYKFDYMVNKLLVSVYDQNGNELVLNNRFISLCKDQVCYLEIKRNINYTNTYFYELKVSGPMKDDVGDSFESAVAIKPDTLVNGSIDNSFDRDIFSITASYTGLYHIYEFSADCNTSAADYDYIRNYVRVYNSNGNLIDFTYPNAIDAYISLKKGETCYIAVSNYRTDPYLFNYKFTIKPPSLDEFGDSMESAKEILKETNIEGCINDFSDMDYFKYTPSKEGEYCIDLTSIYDMDFYPKHETMNILRIYDASGVGLNNIHYKDTKAYFYLKGNADYYFAIQSAGVCSWFDYKFKLIGPIMDDYGNDFETATEINPGENVLCKKDFYGDLDYFYFKVPSDGIYTLFDQCPEKSLNLWEIYNKNGLLISSNILLPEFFNAKKGEVYYVKFVNNNINSSTDVSFSILGPVLDDFGDSKDNAKEIFLNELVSVSANYVGDDDYMRFIPKEDGLYYLDFTTYDGYAYATNQLSVHDSYWNYYGSYLSCDKKNYLWLKKDSIYYISVLGYNYPCNISFVIKGPMHDDYGNTKESANEIELQDTVDGLIDSINDIDYFKIQSLNSGIYKINFKVLDYEWDNLILSGWMDIYDESGNKVSINQDSSFGYFQVDNKSNYYFCIKNPQSYSMLRYSVIIEGPIDLTGNTKDNATEIKLDQEVKGEVKYSIENDYYKFVPESTGIYVFDSNIQIYSDGNPTTDEDSKLLFDITDLNGNYIYSSYVNKKDSKLYFKLIKDNVYYIKLTKYIVHYYNDTDLKTLKTISYSFVLKGPIADDCGDVPSFSKAIGKMGIIEGKIDFPGDIDCYSFIAPYNGIYRLYADSVDLEVRDSKNKQLDRESMDSDNNGRYYFLNANEIYYIFSYKRSDLDNYKISIDKPIFTDHHNPINFPEIIGIDSLVSGGVNYPGNVDSFNFYPQDTGNIYLKLNAPYYFSVKLTRQSGGEVGYTYIRDNIISFSAVEGSSYKIDVLSNDPLLMGNYSLMVSENLEELVDDTYKIRGYIKPDFVKTSRSQSKTGFTVSIAGTNYSSVTDESGYFEITDVPKSLTGYDISIIKNGYLKREIKGIKVENDVELSKADLPIEIWAGDLNFPQDNVINIIDIVKVAKAFNSIKGDSYYDESLDINGDSVINIMDVITIAKHFNQAGSDYPQVVC